MSAFPRLIAEGGSRRADRPEIRRALSILLAPGGRHELRGLPGGRCRPADHAHLDAATDAAVELSDGHVYYSLNPIRAGAERASKATVTARRWLLVDCDPIRPVELSSTDDEKAAALDLACRVVDRLSLAGWPEPLVVDSGNGYHVLYRVDLPNDPLSQLHVKGVLARLGVELDTPGARVDPANHDAPRIAKLPGTWARKGPDTPDRPHRPCRIYHEPGSFEVVPAGLIRDFADPPEAAPAGKPSLKATATAGSADIDRRVIAYLAKCEPAVSGSGGHNKAFGVVCRVGPGFDLDPETSLRFIRDHYNPRCEPPWSEAELRHKVEDAYKEEPRRGWLKDAAATAKPIGPMDGPKPASPLIVWANTITPKRVEFLWPGRIPVGKLTTFAGQGGLGKTFALCDIAARVSRGMEWPFADGECAREGKVLFISGEDDEDDTLVPRLIECDADLRRIAFLSPGSQDDFSLAALDLLNSVLDEMDGVTLVAIDPPTSYLGDIDDHRNAELRSLLTPLKRWAAARKAAVIFNTHVTKATGKDVEAATRVMGSVAWVNAVRAAHLFLRDEDNPEKVYFAPIKCNVARMPKALSYSIVPTEDGWARVEWLAEHDQSADQVIRGERKSAGMCAVDWLESRFGEHRVWESEELKREALACGLTFSQVFKSPEVNALPIRKRPEPDMNGVRKWYWHAQPGWPPERPSESPESPKVGT